MVAEVKTYTVRAEKRGEWWLLTSADAPGAVSQVRSLGQAEEHAREAISFVTGVPESEVEVAVVPALPDRLGKKVRLVKQSVKEMEKAQRITAQRSREAVADLVAAGYKGREVAAVLGVTPQRVSQLLKSQGDGS